MREFLCEAEYNTGRVAIELLRFPYSKKRSEDIEPKCSVIQRDMLSLWRSIRND